MKKLIIILSSITLLFSSLSSVVACKDKDNIERFKRPDIADKIKKWIIAEINGDPNYVNYSFNDLFNKTDLKTLAIRLLDMNISKHYYTIEENTRARFINKSQEKEEQDGLIANQIVEFIKQVALDKLYTNYLVSIDNNSSLEFKMASQGYLPDYQTSNWYVQGLTSDFLESSNQSKFDNVFQYTKKQLKNNKNNIFNTKTINYNTSLFSGFNILSDIEKKQALKIRFNDYYIYSVVPTVIDTILTSTYLHQNQFKLHNSGPNPEDKIIYINKFNALFNNIQTWNDNSNWKTYIKMVWEVKIHKKELKNVVGYNNEKIIYINDFLAKGNDKIELFIALKELFNNIFDDKRKNEVLDGIDPIFGLNGFKGFAGFNKSDNSMFTKFNGDTPYIDDIKNQTQAGIIISNSNAAKEDISRYEYITPNQKKSSLVFVLPIYAIDLLKNMNFNYTYGSENNKQLQMKYYGVGGIPINLDFQWLNQDSSVKWLYNSIGYLGTRDKNGNKLYNVDGIPDYKYSDRLWKTNLLKWVEYIIAQNTTLQTSGKNKLYSSAFDYNPNNIYSQTLYDEIGSYIQKEDDK